MKSMLLIMIGTFALVACEAVSTPDSCASIIDKDTCAIYASQCVWNEADLKCEDLPPIPEPAE